MRTDVKVGLICALAIVLCVVVYFVTRGRTQPPAARADASPSHVTANSDLHAASPGTPGNPVVSSDPYLPDHSLAGNPVGGGVIRMPGDPAPGAPGAPTATAATQSTVAPAAGAPVAGAATVNPLATGTTGGTGATGSPTGAPGMGATGSGTTGAIPTIGSGAGAPWNPLAGATTTSASPTHATVVISGLGGGPASTAGATTYKIQKGDMFISIAKKNGVTLKALQIANPGVDSNHLKIGDTIKIPAATTASTTATTGATSSATSLAGTGTTPSHATVHNTPTTGGGAAAHPVRAVSTTIKPGSVYVIKKGDTLASISRAAYGNGGGTQKIFRANRDELNDPDVMPVGASIKIP